MRQRIDNAPKLSDYTMPVSADSKEELDEAIEEHRTAGWTETKRIIGRDGTFHATLRKRTR